MIFVTYLFLRIHGRINSEFKCISKIKMAQKVKVYLQCNNVTQKNLIGPIELGGARFSLSIECDTGQSEEKATVGDF